jgi:hypothetical protein
VDIYGPFVAPKASSETGGDRCSTTNVIEGEGVVLRLVNKQSCQFGANLGVLWVQFQCS